MRPANAAAAPTSAMKNESQVTPPAHQQAVESGDPSKTLRHGIAN
jgi:hypothetical protein